MSFLYQGCESTQLGLLEAFAHGYQESEPEKITTN